MPENATFPCPSCAVILPTGAPSCTACGIRLTGPDAARLWQLNQQIGTLRAEAEQLVARLKQPEPEYSGPPTDPSPVAVNPYARTASPRSMSGQQILLSLGALLLLSACAFFLVVVWLVVGIVGQALIMVCLTGAAVAGSAFATSRRLPAAAETAAVIATGLLLLDLSSAHSLGLAGLDRVDTDRYWLFASLLAGGLLLSWQHLMPTTRSDQPLRRILTYRPAAAIAFTTTPWILLEMLELEGPALTVACALVAAVNVGTAYAFRRTSEGGEPAAVPFGARAVSVPAAIPFAAAILAGLGYLGTGFLTAYNLQGASDGDITTLDRYLATLLMALGPLAVTVASTRVSRRFLDDTRRSTLPLVASLWALPVLGVPLLDAPWPTFVALAVLTAGYVALADADTIPSPTTQVRTAWAEVIRYLAYAAQPACYLITLALVTDDHTTLAQAMIHPEVTAGLGDSATLLASVPALLWALTAAHGAVRHRSAGFVAAAEVGLYAGLCTALQDAGRGTWTLVMVAGFAANVALAAYAAHQRPSTEKPSAEPEAEQPVAGRPPVLRFWNGVDLCAVLSGALYAVTAVATTLDEPTVLRCSLVLITIGVLVLVYAASPERLPTAYLGSLAISAGTALLSWKAGAIAVEVYTGPLVVLLALIGFVQWRRNHATSTVLTMGPALSVAMGPTLFAGLAGDQARLVAVTFAAVVFLVAGLAAQWKAPVTTSSLVLVVVAVTQGGPLVGYVPGWVLLGGAGSSLLTVGVAWERATLAGRRANAWYGALA